LIIDPGEEVENLALLMKRVSGRQTRYVNKMEGRSGTLWEGRYKSSPIKAGEYLLSCCRYIELNPVRAKIVEKTEEYKWSSYHYKVGIEELDWLDLDLFYVGLGKTKKEREDKYKKWMEETVPDGEWELIRKVVQRGQLTGSNRFIEEVSKRTGKRIEFRGQGRPKSREK
ncbi:MAG: transposase, partial [Nitrospinota bacterium]